MTWGSKKTYREIRELKETKNWNYKIDERNKITEMNREFCKINYQII